MDPIRPPGPKVLFGRVTSDKQNKTRTVIVQRVAPHPKYPKLLQCHTKVHVHDEYNDSREGDVVRIVESRPLSRTKRWLLLEVIEKSGQAELRSAEQAQSLGRLASDSRLTRFIGYVPELFYLDRHESENSIAPLAVKTIWDEHLRERVLSDSLIWAAFEQFLNLRSLANASLLSNRLAGLWRTIPDGALSGLDSLAVREPCHLVSSDAATLVTSQPRLRVWHQKGAINLSYVLRVAVDFSGTLQSINQPGGQKEPTRFDRQESQTSGNLPPCPKTPFQPTVSTMQRTEPGTAAARAALRLNTTGTRNRHVSVLPLLQHGLVMPDSVVFSPANNSLQFREFILQLSDNTPTKVRIQIRQGLSRLYETVYDLQSVPHPRSTIGDP
jgi:small subunit ribosomal protein S17